LNKLIFVDSMTLCAGFVVGTIVFCKINKLTMNITIHFETMLYYNLNYVVVALDGFGVVPLNLLLIELGGGVLIDKKSRGLLDELFGVLLYS
jgi:hypothetical protein